MKRYVRKNREAWEETLAHAPDYGKDVVERLKHERWPFFDAELAGFLKKADLAGRTVAQYFANNGRELLSLVKNAGAARGVGFDLARNLVAQATGFAQATGLPCEFVAADLLELGTGWDDSFDAGLITVGALCWVDDLATLFKTIRRTMKPGATLFIREIHPYTNMLAIATEPEFDATRPTVRTWPYFRDDPFIDAMGMTYMAGSAYPSKTFTSYAHTLAAIFTALLENGFTITAFTESDEDRSDHFAHLEGLRMPLSFLLVAKAI